MKDQTLRLGRVATVSLAVLFGSLGASAVGAQGDSAPATPGGVAAAHPAHIHTGTCETLGDVVFPLNDVTNVPGDATPAATPSIVVAATPEAGSAAQSSTTVEVALDDIISGGHAINVHESADNIDVYIACGDVTGEVTDGTLEVRLEELNGSGFAGLATLTVNEDGTTTVEIILTPGGIGPATPMATPAG